MKANWVMEIPIIEEIIKIQEADGYIGNMNPENRMRSASDILETGYIIYGLIRDYKYFGNKQSLISASKAADYIVKNWSSMPADWENTTKIAVHVCVTGIERTMLTLYGITGDNRYLEFCLKQLGPPIYNQAIALRHATGDLEPFTVAGREGWLAGHDPERAPVHVAELDGRTPLEAADTPKKKETRKLANTKIQ